MSNETKPHHRRAAAEALEDHITPPHYIQRWIETGEWGGICSRQLDAIAQAIADAEERGRQEIRDAVLSNCDFVDYQPELGYEENLTLENAKQAATESLEQMLDGDSGWHERTEDVCYGLFVRLGRAVETSREPAPPGDYFDEHVTYELQDTPVRAFLLPGEQPGRLIGGGK
jgi:hypothetical protein